MLAELKKTKLKILVAVGLIILTVIATVLKIRVGLDNDEVFIVYLAYRISQGKIMLVDSWDVYVTTAVIPAILIKIYMFFTHSIDGVVLFLRTVSAVFQYFVALMAFRIFRKRYSGEAAFCAAIVIANILPRATQNFEYGFNTICFFMITALLLFDVYNGGGSDLLKIIAAGVSYGLAVFTYPTMLITLPYIVFLLMTKIHPDIKIRIKYSLVFTCGCGVLFLIFLWYILSNMTLTEFIINIRGLLGGGDHSGFFQAFSNTRTLIKLIIRPLALVAASCFIYLIIRIKSTVPPIIIFYIYMALTCFAIIGLNVTGLRPSGPFGLLERYIVYAVMALIFVAFIRKDYALLYFFCIMGIFTFLGALAGTNLGFGENAMYLEPAIIAFVISAVEYMNVYEAKGGISALMKLCILLMLVEMIFSKGYFVRITGTSPANITEKRVMSDAGITDGIFLYSEQIEDWDREKVFIEGNTSEGKTYLCVSRDTLLNSFFNGEMTAPQYVGTFVPGQQWVDYYTIGKRLLPDHIFIDKRDYEDLQTFMDTPFGRFAKDKYVDNGAGTGSDFYLMDKSSFD